MKHAPILVLLLVLVATGIGQESKTASQLSQPETLTSALDLQINGIEKLVLDVAEAMPEDKFNFSPESLKIPGAEYKGVRTFAGQLKHIAASNYLIWSSLTADKLPEDFKDGSGPENVKTKAEIIKFLKDSFALGHRAAATLTPQNMLESSGRSSRLNRATFGVAHAYNHYGQMI